MEMSSRWSILDTRFNVKQEVKFSGIVPYNEVTNICMASLYLQGQCCLLKRKMHYEFCFCYKEYI